jgi:hypothetical protein
MNTTFTAGTKETDPIRANTAPAVLQKIDSTIEERVRFYATQPEAVISRRIQELEREWDIERWLQANAAGLALSGLLFGVLGRKRWFLLSGGVLSFLLLHSIQGWCPPVPAFRRLGLRTRREIDREKYALKVLRGDFREVGPTDSAGSNASQVMVAVAT